MNSWSFTNWVQNCANSGFHEIRLVKMEQRASHVIFIHFYCGQEEMYRIKEVIIEVCVTRCESQLES